MGEPLVWIIDNDHWPRVYLRSELIERGFDAIGFEEVRQALAAMGDKDTVRPVLIILELRGQPLHTIELDNLMRFGIPVIALFAVSQAQEPVLDRYEWKAVFRRPITIGEICDKIEALVTDQKR